MDSLEELSPVESLSGFLPEEVPSIFQEFQDIIQMDCSAEDNGRLHNNEYNNNESVSKSSARTRTSDPSRDYECSSCPVSSTLKTIKHRENKTNDQQNYVRSGKPSTVRPYSHNNFFRKKYGGSHQHKNCTNGSTINECDFESRAPYFPHCDERLTTDTFCRMHQHNTNSSCTQYNNLKNKRCMKSVSCSENAKESSLAQLLCDTEPSQVHTLGSSNNATNNASSYSSIKRIPKNNYVNPNKVLQIFEEDECHHPAEEHVDCYDCNSTAMLCLIDTTHQDNQKSNRIPVSLQNSLAPSSDKTNNQYHNNEISKHIYSLNGCRSIPKHIPPAVSSRISIPNKSFCENDNSKNNSSLRLLLEPEDTDSSSNSSALRALLVADSKNNNKHGSNLRLLPAPNAPTMQQLLMSKEPIRVRGCSGAVVNPSVLHNLLVTGRDVIAGYSITSSTAKSDEFIISRNSTNGHFQNDMFIREREDDDNSSRYFSSSDFSQREQNSEESPKNIKFGGQVSPDFPINSKELTGPYSVCSECDKKTAAPYIQNCRTSKVECHSSTNTTSQSRTRSDLDTRESLILDSSCEIFDSTNQRTATNQGCNSSRQRILTQKNNEQYSEEDMDHHIDNQDPLVHSGICAAGLNVYQNTNEEEKREEEEEDPEVGINIYRNIQDDTDFSLPSLYDLAQQTDYELNTPPSSSNLLQCSDLFMTLEHAF